MKTKSVSATDLVLLKHHLTALHLPTIKSECEATARQCANENLDYLGFLLRLCERELADREQRACQRRVRAAKFPQLKSLDDFDFRAQPSLKRALVLELARCAFIDRRESVILLGGPGTGKTHVAIGLAAAACQRGKKVRFCRLTELLTQLLFGAGRAAVGPVTGAVGAAGSVGAGRIGLRAGEPGGGGVAVRRVAYGLREDERDRDDEPAVRALDGGAGQRAAGSRHAGPADASLSPVGSHGGELPLEGSPGSTE